MRFTASLVAVAGRATGRAGGGAEEEADVAAAGIMAENASGVAATKYYCYYEYCGYGCGVGVKVVVMLLQRQQQQQHCF